MPYRSVRLVELLCVYAGFVVFSLFLTACNLSGPANANAVQETYGPVVGSTTQLDNTNQPISASSTSKPVLTQTQQKPTRQPTATKRPTATPSPTVPPTAGPSPTPLPRLNSQNMGIQAYGYASNWGEMLDRSYFMGFRWVKFQLSWKELEPQKGQFSQQFDVLIKNAYDTAVFRGAGFKVLLSIAKAPDWARPPEARGQNDGPPANPQDLVDFVNVVLQKFDLSRLGAIEIWNEPNAIADWTGKPLSGAAYMSLFNPAYKAIRAASKDLMVISAGPTPTGDTNGSIDDRRWLQEIYSAGLPINDPNFAIGAHPYGWANAPDARCCTNPSQGWDDHPTFFFLDTLYTYRDIMVKNNHSQGKIWVTEFGWSSFDGLKVGSHVDGKPAMPPTDPGLAWMARLTQEQQAQYIVRAYELAQTTDLAQFVGPMFLWNLNFAALPEFLKSDQPSRTEAGFSVLNGDTFPRRAFEVLSAAEDQKNKK